MRFNCGQGILSPFKFKNFITPTCRTNQGVLSKFSVHQVGEEILINVREGQSEEMALTINAVSGAEMFQTILKQNETYHSVRTSRWAHGIYLVSLKTSVGVKTKKVVLN